MYNKILELINAINENKQEVISALFSDIHFVNHLMGNQSIDFLSKSIAPLISPYVSFQLLHTAVCFNNLQLIEYLMHNPRFSNFLLSLCAFPIERPNGTNEMRWISKDEILTLAQSLLSLPDNMYEDLLNRFPQLNFSLTQEDLDYLLINNAQENLEVCAHSVPHPF